MAASLTATMNSTGQQGRPRGGRDLIPEMPPAGKVDVIRDEMQEVMRQKTPPKTPDHLKPFRISTQRAPGHQNTRYQTTQKGGQGRTFEQNTTFGHANVYNDSTKSTIDSMKQPIYEPPKRQYASEKKEPLGRSAQYGFKLPEETGKADFKFGIKSITSESAKSVVNPPDSEIQTMSPRYEAGTQSGRNYTSWTVNPAQHRFGKVRVETAPDDANPTQLTTVATANFRLTHNHELGTPRKTGAAPATETNHAFGVSKLRDAGELKAALTQDHVTIHNDVGTTSIKSPTQRRLRQQDMMTHTNSGRTFGTASVRTDMSPPRFRKVSDNMNYGDEQGTSELLRGTADRSLMTMPIPNVEAAQRMNQRCSFGLSDRQAAEAYNVAAERFGLPVTAESFRVVVNGMTV